MANILETARDLGQGIYTKAEVDDSLTDIQESSLSKVASNVLLSGNLALASSAVTKSNANITYAGNSGTQSITTGITSVDFTVASNGSGYYHDRTAGDCIVKNDAGTVIESGSAVVNVSKVHIKSRSNAQSNHIYDGLRGYQQAVLTDSTQVEDSYGGCNPSGINGFSLQANTTRTNRSGYTYIAHQILYTHIKWGLTSQGKRYITAYNPVTREVMTMYQGSGIAGHQIPNALGIKLDWIESKGLDSTYNWAASRLKNTTLFLNKADSEYSNRFEYTDFTSNYTEVENDAYTNGTGFYISYGFANSETKIITQYQGTGASGNFVETKDVNGVVKKPRRVITKRTSGTGSWCVFDSERGSSLSRVLLDTSGAESTSEFITIDTTGFVISDNLTSDFTNASGHQYITIVEFDTTNSNDDTYFDLPVDNSVVNITNATLGFTEGINSSGYNTSSESIAAETISASGIADGIYYVYKNKAGNYGFDSVEPIFAGDSAETDGYYFNTDDGKWYNDSDTEQTSRSYIMKVIVASETIMDIL